MRRVLKAEQERVARQEEEDPMWTIKQAGPDLADALQAMVEAYPGAVSTEHHVAHGRAVDALKKAGMRK